MYKEVSEFCEKLGIDIPPYREGVINPGEKSVASLKNKIYRNVVMLENDEYTLRNVNDMIRCTITVNSYSEVPQLLHDLKEEIPSLTGYISEYENGYRGIHLNFTIDGFNAEIQIHTAEVAFTNQATESIYTKWRSFDEKLEIEKLLSSNLSEEELKRRTNEILKKGQQAKMEYEECQKLYEKQNSLTDFEEHSQTIRGILDAFSYEIKNVPKEKLPENIDDILKVKPYKDKQIQEGMLDKQAKLLNAEAKIRQDKLIQIANNCRGKIKKNANSFEMREIEKFFMNASIEWDRIFYSEIGKKIKTTKKFNHLINRKKYSCIQKIYQYAIDNKMNLFDTKHIMKEFFCDERVRETINKNPTKFSEISDVDIIGIAEYIVEKEMYAYKEKQTTKKNKTI